MAEGASLGFQASVGEKVESVFTLFENNLTGELLHEEGTSRSKQGPPGGAGTNLGGCPHAHFLPSFVPVSTDSCLHVITHKAEVMIEP